jgi:hypothetical protein
MGVERPVEVLGGADKTVEVFEVFEVRSYLEEEFVGELGEPRERGFAADASFRGIHCRDVLPNTKSVELMR